MKCRCCAISQLFVMAGIERVDAAGEVAAAAHEAARLHEGAHDGDVDLHGTRGVQHTGEHGHALFGEGVGRSAAAAVCT